MGNLEHFSHIAEADSLDIFAAYNITAVIVVFVSMYAWYSFCEVLLLCYAVGQATKTKAGTSRVVLLIELLGFPRDKEEKRRTSYTKTG